MDDLRGALALMPDAALLAEPQGRVLAANEAAAELFQTPELEGRPLAELLPLRPKPDRGWRPAQARRVSGTPVPVEACAREVSGRLLYCVRALRESVVLEEALRYFDVAFDRSPIGMAVFNTDGEYVRVNAALPAAGREEAEHVARVTVEVVRDLSPESRQGGVGLTASVGAAVIGDPDLTAEAVLRAADRAMYEAKRAGRDRFVVT